MRNLFLLTVAACSMTAMSCKKQPQPRPAPEGGQVAAPATAPASVQPATAPAGVAQDERELVRFIAVSRKIVAMQPAGRFVDRSPEGFAALAAGAESDAAIAAALNDAGWSAAQWKSAGTRAWSAWSVAQVDYNAEAPLRENQQRLAEAQRQLASARATLKGGTRVMSDAERTRRVAALRDTATDANDRAQRWADKAERLRERIERMQGLSADVSDSNPSSAPVRQAAAETFGPAITSLSQELAAAERNEQESRDHGRLVMQAAEHPELAMDSAEKEELLREARGQVESASAEIRRLEQEAVLLRARLGEDRRVDAAAREQAGTDADIALVRKHLGEFNEAWGMTIEGVRQE